MLYVFDIDGTICFDYKSLDPQAVRLLDHLKNQGKKIAFASARPRRDMLPVLDEKYHDELMVGANGSIVSKGKQLLYSSLFDSNKIKTLHRILSDHKAIIFADGLWNYHYNGDGQHRLMDFVDAGNLADNLNFLDLKEIIKITIFEAEDMSQLLNKLKEEGFFLEIYEKDDIFNITITPGLTSKATGLKQIISQPYMAFGNDLNDIEMFKFAKVSVLIDDHPEVLPYADYQVFSGQDYFENLINIIDMYE